MLKTWEAIKLMQESGGKVKLHGIKVWEEIHGYIHMDEFGRISDAYGAPYNIRTIDKVKWEIVKGE